MDRRDFLRSAGTTAASGYLVAMAAGVASATDRPQWNRWWRPYLSNPDAHPLIPNVSHAGYRRGELPPPRPAVRASVTAFGVVGDGTTDCTAAFNEAVERVGAAGGGAVYVPPGTYRLSGIVWVHHSRVVLRGAGRGRTRLFFERSLTECYRPASRNEWSWSGGLVWFIPRELRAALETSGFTGNEGWLDNRDLTTVSSDVPRGRRRVPVADPSVFRPGQHVLLLVDNTTDNTLLAHLSGDVPGTATYPWSTSARRLRPELTDWPLAVNFAAFRFPVQIHRVEKDAVVLAQPVRTDLRSGWAPRFAALSPVFTESGHSDNGFGSTTTKNVSLTGVRVGGRARLHTFTTPLAAGAAHHGINTEGFSSGNVWSNGTMEGTFDSHRALPFDSVRTAITVTDNGTTGGAGDAGPRWGARFCHWNVEVLGGRAHGVRLEEHAPHSAMVGIRGTSGPTDHPKDFTGELSSVVDALDEPVLPVNLYEAQLRHRLRGTT